MTINGVSTCAEAGTEKYERFQSGIGRRRRTLVQYDYRHPIDRELFSCVKPTLDECRDRFAELDYQRLIGRVHSLSSFPFFAFSEPITALDGIFDDTGAWGTDTLKGWIDDYESTRFTATDSHTAVITSEYNMECVKEWLQRQTPISEMREF